MNDHDESTTATVNPVALAKLDEPRKSRKNPRAKSETTDPDRKFDTTALHAHNHGQHTISHADYIAHSERYDFAFRSIQKGDRVLDVGCGVDMPLYQAISKIQSKASLLYAHGGVYIGTDYNMLRRVSSKWAAMVGSTDVTSAEGIARCVSEAEELLGPNPDVPFGGFTLVVCLEVIEHMHPDSGRRLLENVRDMAALGGKLLLSTPVYDGKGQARNHLHEYYIDELEALILDVGGLTIERRMGTFANERDVKRWLKEHRPDWLEAYNAAREFHTSTYMSGVYAPMLPDLSRNNLWELRRAE